MNQLRQKYTALNQKERQAFWITIAMAGALLLAGLYTFRNFFIGAFFSFEVLANFTTWILAIIAFTSSWLILNGRSTLGGYVFVAGVSIGFLGTTGITSGLGFLFAGATFVVITYFANLLMSDRVLGWSPILGLFVSIAILLLDAFCPWQRIVTAGADLYRSYATGVVLLVGYLIFFIRQFSAFPLRAKMVNSLLAAVLLPVAMLAVITNVMTQRALSTSAQQSLLASASQVVKNLDGFVSDNLDQIRAEAQTDDFVAFLEKSPEEREEKDFQYVNALLNAFMKKNLTFISAYGILDSKSIVVASTNQEDVGLDQSGHNYAREVHRTGSPFVSPLFVPKGLQEPFIFFSAPIRNTAGQTIGILWARYNARVIQQTITNMSDSEENQQAILVVDDHNILLADNTESDTIFKSIAPLSAQQIADLQAAGIIGDLPAEQLVAQRPALVAALQNAASGTSFSGDFHAGDTDSTPASHQDEAVVVDMTSAPWRVVLAASQEVLYAPLQARSRGTMLLGIGASLLVALLAVLLAKYISDPIISLTNVAKRVASGDLSARAPVRSSDEFGTLANAFNTMSEQLTGLVGSLEQRVADRTRALETSVQVSRRISTMLDANQLVLEVVEQVKLAFNYYHVHIYLFDDARENLIMAGGSGEPGRMMLSRGHKIVKGKGLVGRAAETGSPVLVKDVSQAPNWLPNPLLPHTKSEVAVPIAIGGNVLGVLDVQQDEVGALQQEDADLLQSIANQIAVALQNTRIYAQVQHQASREALIAAIGQRIQHTSTTEDALKIAVREVGRAIGMRRTTVSLEPREENGGTKK